MFIVKYSYKNLQNYSIFSDIESKIFTEKYVD